MQFIMMMMHGNQLKAPWLRNQGGGDEILWEEENGIPVEDEDATHLHKKSQKIWES